MTSDFWRRVGCAATFLLGISGGRGWPHHTVCLGPSGLCLCFRVIVNKSCYFYLQNIFPQKIQYFGYPKEEVLNLASPASPFWKVLSSFWNQFGTSGLVFSLHLGFQRRSSLAKSVFFNKFCSYSATQNSLYHRDANILGNLPRMGKKEVECEGVKQTTGRMKQITVFFGLQDAPDHKMCFRGFRGGK